MAFERSFGEFARAATSNVARFFGFQAIRNTPPPEIAMPELPESAPVFTQEPLLDAKEPTIESRAQLVKALDKLCTYYYVLLGDRHEDMENGTYISFRPDGSVLTEEEDAERVLDDGTGDCVLLWQTKIGGVQDIPTPERVVSNLKYPPSVETESREELLRMSNSLGHDQHDLKKQDAAYGEIYRRKRREYLHDNTALDTYVAAYQDGLALVTIGRVDYNTRQIYGFEHAFIDPDDIFAPSSTQEEHQALYHEVIWLLSEHIGKYLRHAPDTRLVMKNGKPEDGLVGKMVDITDGFEQIDPETLRELQSALGREGGTPWPQLPTVNKYPATEAPTVAAILAGEENETVFDLPTITTGEVVPPAFTDDNEQLFKDLLSHFRENPSYENLVLATKAKEYKAQLSQIQQKTYELILDGEAELVRTYGTYPNYRDDELVLVGEDDTMNYMIYFKRTRQDRANASLFAQPKGSSATIQYDLFSIDATPSGAPHPGRYIIPSYTLPILNVLYNVHFTLQT